jgi:hypothetical protein
MLPKLTGWHHWQTFPPEQDTSDQGIVGAQRHSPAPTMKWLQEDEAYVYLTYMQLNYNYPSLYLVSYSPHISDRFILESLAGTSFLTKTSAVPSQPNCPSIYIYITAPSFFAYPIYIVPIEHFTLSARFSIIDHNGCKLGPSDYTRHFQPPRHRLDMCGNYKKWWPSV